MIKIIIAFFVAQLLNVILSTLKSIITIKGGKRLAAIANAISYGFNTIVIKAIVDVSIEVAIIISVTCNLIGVYFALWITEKMRKDQLWKITATVESDNLEPLLKELEEILGLFTEEGQRIILEALVHAACYGYQEGKNNKITEIKRVLDIR